MLARLSAALAGRRRPAAEPGPDGPGRTASLARHLPKLPWPACGQRSVSKCELLVTALAATRPGLVAGKSLAAARAAARVTHQCQSSPVERSYHRRT